MKYGIGYPDGVFWYLSQEQNCILCTNLKDQCLQFDTSEEAEKVLAASATLQSLGFQVYLIG